MFEARFKPGDSYITIKLNGHVRTVVESLAFHNAGYTLEYNKEYPMCNYPHEKVGGSFWLRMSDNSCQSLTNPPVAFYNDSTQPPQIVNLPAISESLTLIDELRSNGGEYIFFDGLSDPVCSTLSDVTEAKDAPGK